MKHTVKLSEQKMLPYSMHESMSCFHCGCWGGRRGTPTLHDGQAAELPQGCGGRRAAEQGQCVGGKGADVGVRGQGHAGLQEMLRSGNGAPLLLPGGVGSGALGGRSAPSSPATHCRFPPVPAESTGWLCILLELPSPAAPAFKTPSPFLYTGANFFQMKTEHSTSTRRHSGESKQSLGHPTPPCFITKLASETHSSGPPHPPGLASNVASSRERTKPGHAHPHSNTSCWRTETQSVVL